MTLREIVSPAREIERFPCNCGSLPLNAGDLTCMAHMQRKAILSLVIGTRSCFETDDRKVQGMSDILYEVIATYPLILIQMCLRHNIVKM